MYSFFSPTSFNSPLDDPEIRRRIYSHIVKSLTCDRRLLKRVKRYFDPVDYNVLSNYAKKNRIDRCVYTSNYLLVYLKPNRIIVVGYDRTRAKLFVNLLHRYTEIREYDGEDQVDHLVRTALFGYDQDVDQDEFTVSTDQTRSYRVQGDLVIVADPIRDQDLVDVYADHVVHSTDFYRSYCRYVVFKIHVLLNSLRISHEINADRGFVEIERTVHKYTRSYSDKLEKLTKIMRKLVCDHLGDLCKTVGINTWVSDGWRNQYKRILIEVENVNYTSKLVNEIRELIKQNISKDHYVIYHGNHRVEIDQAYPRSIRVVYDDHEFVGSADPVFVDKDTTLTITHDQHGKVVVKFDRPYVVLIRSTASAWDQDLIYTFYSIKQLLEKYNLY